MEKAPVMETRPDLEQLDQLGATQKKLKLDYDQLYDSILAIALRTDIAIKAKAKEIFLLVNGVKELALRYRLLTNNELWRKVIAAMNLPEWRAEDKISYYGFVYDQKTKEMVLDPLTPKFISIRQISSEENSSLLLGEELYTQFLEYSAKLITQATQAQALELAGGGCGESDDEVVIVKREDGVEEEVIMADMEESEALLMKATSSVVNDAVSTVIQLLADKHENMNQLDGLVPYNYLIVELAAMDPPELSALIMPNKVTTSVQEIDSRVVANYAFMSSLQLISQQKTEASFFLAQSANSVKYPITLVRYDGTTNQQTGTVEILTFPYPIIEGTKFAYEGFVYWHLKADTHGLFIVTDIALTGYDAYVYPLMKPVKLEEGMTPLTEEERIQTTLRYDDIAVINLDDKLRYCWYAYQSNLMKDVTIVCDISKLAGLRSFLAAPVNPLIMEADSFDRAVNVEVKLPRLVETYKVLHVVVPAKVDPESRNYLAVFLSKVDKITNRGDVILRIYVYSSKWRATAKSKTFKLPEYNGNYKKLTNFKITFLHPLVFLVQFVDSSVNNRMTISRVIHDNLLTSVVTPTSYELSDMPLSDQMKYLLTQMINNNHYMLYYNPHGRLFDVLFHKISTRDDITRLTVFKQLIASNKAAYATKFIIDDGKDFSDSKPFNLMDLQALAILDFIVDNNPQLLFALRQKGNNRWFLAELRNGKHFTESESYDLSRAIKMACSSCTALTSQYAVEEQAFYCNEECRTLNNSFLRLGCSCP